MIDEKETYLKRVQENIEYDLRMKSRNRNNKKPATLLEMIGGVLTVIITAYMLGLI